MKSLQPHITHIAIFHKEKGPRAAYTSTHTPHQDKVNLFNAILPLCTIVLIHGNRVKISRPLSKQAVKAVRSPRLLPPSSTAVKLRHVHCIQASYSRPLSHERFTQRFPTQPDPLAYFSEKRHKPPSVANTPTSTISSQRVASIRENSTPSPRIFLTKRWSTGFQKNPVLTTFPRQMMRLRNRFQCVMATPSAVTKDR